MRVGVPRHSLGGVYVLYGLRLLGQEALPVCAWGHCKPEYCLHSAHTHTRTHNSIAQFSSEARNTRPLEITCKLTLVDIKRRYVCVCVRLSLCVCVCHTFCSVPLGTVFAPSLAAVALSSVNALSSPL